VNDIDELDGFQLGTWIVWPKLNCLESGGKRVPLEPRAMDLLVFLASHEGEVVSADKIFDNVWKGLIVSDNSLYQSIRQIRKALGDQAGGGQPRYIETISKKGYRLAIKPKFNTNPPPELSQKPVDVGDALITTSAGSVLNQEPVKQVGIQNKNILSSIKRYHRFLIITLAVIISSISIERYFIHDRSPSTIKSIAVLPFIDLSEKGDSSYLAEGTSEEIINMLAQVRSLKVAARTSSFSYKGNRFNC